MVQVQRKPRVGKSIGRKVASKMPEVKDLISAEDDAEIKKLMVICAEQNELMNQHKKSYENARAALLEKLQKFNKNDYIHPTAVVNGSEVQLNAKLEQSSRRVIDVTKLKALVTPAIFLKCVSAAVGTVEAEAGKNVVNQCAETKLSEPNVNVKASARTGA